MTPKFLILCLGVFVLALLRVAQLASFLPESSPVLAHGHGVEGSYGHSSSVSSISSTTATVVEHTSQPASSVAIPSSPSPTESSKTSTEDMNNESDDPSHQPTSPSNESSFLTPPKPNDSSDNQSNPTNETNDESKGKPKGTANPNQSSNEPNETVRGHDGELDAIIYSIFIVYVSVVKLIYHNFTPIKHYLTEPGILMIFGIIWELAARLLTTNYYAFPRFNARIFFYLFLPSTVLESASLLSNKWLFLNMFHILTLSIVGTVIYASSLGYTIYSLSQHDMFRSSLSFQPAPISVLAQSGPSDSLPSRGSTQQVQILALNKTLVPYSDQSEFRASVSDRFTLYSSQVIGRDPIHNLTLADCLIFGTILSSVDSTTILNVFRQHHVNDKLYYLTMGESLMNNAVVLVIFNLLLELFKTTRLTVVRIYFATIQFFANLFGSMLIGISLAAIALLAVRLTKHLQAPSMTLNIYQSQGQAMVETLLILKLAYLTYTLARQAGTSSVLGLATFGILQDQYIKCNLNLRSQLTLRQVVLATKTLGYSLIYPLLGMLLVEVAISAQPYNGGRVSETSTISQLWSSSTDDQPPAIGQQMAGVKLKSFPTTVSLPWNFRFLTMVTVIVLLYRFVVVVVLGLFCNLFSSRQLKIKLSDQFLLAFGGLKGPLSFALVVRLIEHEDYKHKIVSNKHLFISTILFITLISTIIKGALLRPLVRKLQSNNSLKVGQKADYTSTSFVFTELNGKLTEYVAHGLNSIIGHSKSPYDRFSEFNETHIKTWLTRSGSNTNWLSVFYDNLILDETLNATSFFISPASRDQLGSTSASRSIRPFARGRANLSTIGDTPRNQSGFLNGASADQQQAFGGNLAGPSNNKAKQSLVALDSNSRSSTLKQMVMLNLKQDDAKARRDITAAGWTQSRSGFDSSGKLVQDFLPNIHEKRRTVRMLSSTSSADMSHLSRPIPRNSDKQRHLKVIERRLLEDTKALASTRDVIGLANQREARRRTSKVAARASKAVPGQVDVEPSRQRNIDQ